MSIASIAQYNMVEQQVRPWEVLDNRVLSTLSKIKRVDFVREPYKGLAYADCQIPVARGVTMFPPTLEGRMLQALLIDSDDLVLEIGSGSGFISACLAQLAQRVSSIDIDAGVIDFARQNLLAYAFDNIDFEQVDAFQLERDQAFDVIAVTASVAAVPENLKQALKIGGRMFIIVGDSPAMQALLISRASETEWNTQSLFETDMPRLVR
jgi:protein-L-isoaspartate(D-aspartate) O-methyltransferase